MEKLAMATTLQAVKDYFKKDKNGNHPMRDEVKRWFLSDNNLFLGFLNINGESFLKMLEGADEKDVIARMTKFEI